LTDQQLRDQAENLAQGYEEEDEVVTPQVIGGRSSGYSWWDDEDISNDDVMTWMLGRFDINASPATQVSQRELRLIAAQKRIDDENKLRIEEEREAGASLRLQQDERIMETFSAITPNKEEIILRRRSGRPKGSPDRVPRARRTRSEMVSEGQRIFDEMRKDSQGAAGGQASTSDTSKKTRKSGKTVKTINFKKDKDKQ
jgi:hypothetical protein